MRLRRPGSYGTATIGCVDGRPDEAGARAASEQTVPVAEKFSSTGKQIDLPVGPSPVSAVMRRAPVQASALETAYRAHYAPLVAFVTHVTRDPGAAEDIAQDSFDVLAGVDLAAIDDIGAWLRTVAYRRAMHRARRMKRERALPDHETKGGGLAGAAVQGPAALPGLDPELVLALARLSPQQRAAMLLVYGEDMAPTDAASVMDCSPATLRVHLFRGRNALRKLLVAAHDSDSAVVLDLTDQ
jgi:RNA polymerase sigma-70 factor, ECF subfamily